MTDIDVLTENKILKDEVERLSKINKELEERISVFTSTHRQKKYYENHTEEVKVRTKQYADRVKETNPEKLKEWRHTAYLNRKAKLQKQAEAILITVHEKNK